MKKYYNLILSILLFVVLFLKNWFSDELINTLFALYGLLNLFLFVIFMKFFIYMTKKLNNKINIISFVILIFSILFIIFFPYRYVKTNLEFKLFKNERLEIVRMIKNGDLISDEYNNVKLPKKYKKVSVSKEVYVLQNNEEGQVIKFWIFRGLQSGSISLIYSTGDEKLIKENEGGHPIISIEKIEENWFYVRTDY